MDNCIIVGIQGGLGNQMFQYAAGLALALRHRAALKLDCSWFDASANINPPRRYMLDVFIADLTFASEKENRALKGDESFFCRVVRRITHRPRTRYAATFVEEPQYAYWPGFASVSAPAYLSGYWQDERYFVSVAAEIRRNFTFPPLPAGEAETMARRIQDAGNAVAVHVRRGDYVSKSLTHQFHGVCPPEYYSKALEAVATHADAEPEFFLFSDEPVWVRKHFDTRGFSAIVVDFPEHAGNPWHDMHLMSLCKHHIIANSSFSWWGAWLADNGGLVCAPRRWFAKEDRVTDNPAPHRWTLL